jgi:hypothetical protein
MRRVITHYRAEILAILMLKLIALYAIHEQYFDAPASQADRIRHLSGSVYGSQGAYQAVQEVTAND